MISLELQTTFARDFCDICEPTITFVRERDPLLLWEAKICVEMKDVPCPLSIVHVLGKRRTPRLRKRQGLTVIVFVYTDASRRICWGQQLWSVGLDAVALRKDARHAPFLIRLPRHPQPLYLHG